MQRLIGATPEEYEAIAGRSTGSFAEHVRALGTGEEARADRAQQEIAPSRTEPQEESVTQPVEPEAGAKAA